MADVPKKEESSQEASSVKEPEADASARQMVPDVLPQAALGSGSVEVSAADFAAFREWQEKQAQARQGNPAPPSPPKKQKVEDEEDMQEFQAQLVELDINFADLDPELQTKLKTSKNARKDFLAIHTTDQCYNPTDGTWEAQSTAKKRDLEVQWIDLFPTSPRRTTCSRLCYNIISAACCLPWISCTFAATVFTRWHNMNLQLFSIPLKDMPRS